jgi:hypothetical protein
MFSWDMGKITIAELVNLMNLCLYWLELQNLANSKYPYTKQQHAVENFFFFNF